MAKAPVVEEAQMRHAMKVAAVTGQTPARDTALLCVLYGTGMTATEVAQLEVADVLAEGGEYRTASEVRAAIAFNGRRRPIFWTNTRVREALDAYFLERTRLRQGVTSWRSQWRGLVQLGPAFLTADGRPFTLTTRRTSAGNISRSCESLTQAIRKLHDQAGIEAAGATAVRRTFAVRLHRKGYDLRHIREVLGLSTLSATKNLVEGDPVDLGRIVARVI
jgi:site-specific recombinase XerD